MPCESGLGGLDASHISYFVGIRSRVLEHPLNLVTYFAIVPYEQNMKKRFCSHGVDLSMRRSRHRIGWWAFRYPSYNCSQTTGRRGPRLVYSAPGNEVITVSQ